MTDWYGLLADPADRRDAPSLDSGDGIPRAVRFGSITIDAFPIDWEDPTDPELSWEHDDMHMPFAIAPLSTDYVRIVIGGMEYGRLRFDAPWEVLVRFWHGYAYMAGRDLVPDSEQEAAEEAYTQRKRAFIDASEAYWRDTAIPQLTASREWFRSVPVESMSLGELAGAWDEAWRRSERGWAIHFHSIRGAYQVTNDLSEFYEGVLSDAPAGEALRLIQGYAGELHEVDRGLDRLVALITDEPKLRRLFERPDPPSLEKLDGMPEAASFVATLHEFLRAHGHLGGSYENIESPSWSERPSMVLGDLVRRLAAARPSADERRAILLAEAETLAARVRTVLADRAEELATFEALLATARAVGPLTEIHNYWIDRLVQACLRSLALRVGARLVEAGVIGQPEDVLYLFRDEVPELLHAPVDRHATVAARQAEHARQKAMKPPRVVGKPLTPAEKADRFDGARFDAELDGTMRGTGASAGVVRGVARIVLGPEHFGKVIPGDVIVAPSSNPSWVPLFSVAGGLLTNTGGVLCHAAVVAREFGLPAVVGLGDATSRIPDGAFVELDGTTGLVRIL
jgi:rifampicin phosphotransferase